jgi:CRISPR-associated exonuclease Cas4
MYLFWAILLFLLALLVLWASTRQRRDLGIPEGRVLYSDVGVERAVNETLFSDELSLLGRPDYLIQSAAGLVPVEVKSGRTPARPYAAHIYQLAAYCYLVHNEYQQRPPHGIIRYPQRSFTVEYTPQLEAEMIALVEEMQMKRGVELHRSHVQAARCAACGYRAACAERL